MRLDKRAASPQLRGYAKERDLFGDIQSLFFDKGGYFWIAEDIDEHRLAGCVGLVLDESARTGKIKALRVDPDYQRQGIAKKLLTILEDYAMSQNREISPRRRTILISSNKTLRSLWLHSYPQPAATR